MITSQGGKGGLGCPGSPQEVPRGSLGGEDGKGVCVVFEKLFDGFVFSSVSQRRGSSMCVDVGYLLRLDARIFYSSGHASEGTLSSRVWGGYVAGIP